MNDVIVRNVRLNTDDPKICNAIMGATREAIVEEVKILSELGTDLFEWRADTYEPVSYTHLPKPLVHKTPSQPQSRLLPIYPPRFRCV